MTTKSSQNVLPQGTRIGRAAIRVNDLREVTNFYRDVVGLDVLEHTAVRTILGSAEAALLVIEADEHVEERPPASAGLFHTAFRVPSRAALGDSLLRLRDQWHLSGASDHWVSEALYTRDPEGNGVEIYRDFPREEWPLTQDGRVQLGTEPLDLERLEAVGTKTAGVPAGTDIGHIHLEVTSLEAFHDFYVDTLGFEVQTAMADAYFVSAGGYHHHLGANTWHRRSEPVSGRGLLWFEIVVPDKQSLNELRERLAGTQHAVSEMDTGLSVTDADGITIRFLVE